MNKLYSLLSAIVITTFSAFNYVYATSLYYTISTNGTYMPSGVIELFEQPLEYIIRVDGTHNPTLQTINDRGDELYRLNFDATLISGTGLEIGKDQPDSIFTGVIIRNPTLGYMDVALDLSAHGTNGNFGYHPWIPRTDDIPLEIVTSYDAFTNWVVGNMNTGDDRLTIANTSCEWYTSVSLPCFSSALGHMNITSISPELPTTNVPEPETYLLFGLGLIAVNAVRRRKAV